MANILIRAAAADVAAHDFIDIGIARLFVFREQRRGGHDLAGLAVSALRNVAFEPGALHRVIAVGGESFDCGDVLARDERNRRTAGTNRLAIEVDGAGAAQRHAAAELGAGHAEGVAQDPEQRHLRHDIDGLLFAVQSKRDFAVAISVCSGYNPLEPAARALPLHWFGERDLTKALQGLFQSMRPLKRATALRDATAGVALAAMSIPQSLGYAAIAGMPAVTGFYTLLLPALGFAAFGSSRYLVVAADSATAAILAGGISGIEHPGSARYIALAGLVALLTAVFLAIARLLKLGFIADFLSQTVLVGFLTGVGFQVGIAVLGQMLRIPVDIPSDGDATDRGNQRPLARCTCPHWVFPRSWWRFSSASIASRRRRPVR